MLGEIYIELSGKLTEIEDIKWIDLWTNQINFFDTELPFPAPAVFLSFQSDNMLDRAMQQQEVTMLVSVYVFFETFADSFNGSYNRNSALEFTGLMKSVNTKLHGTSGESYSSMSRKSMQPIETSGAGILYLMTYECSIIDCSASPETTTTTASDVNVINEAPPEEPPTTNLFFITQ